MSNRDPYKDLYRREGVEITEEEARNARHNLVGFIKALIEADKGKDSTGAEKSNIKP